MILFVVIAILICLYGINFKSIKSIDADALNQQRTTMINGIFVIIILFSHFFGYVQLINSIDIIIKNLISIKLSQLMVTTFLFYSGYGIFESIKNKKDYIKNFPKKRLLKVYIPFFIALCLFTIINFIFKKNYPIETYLMSLTGWQSIGNSNWFMFCVFFLYISTYISFSIFHKKENGLLFTTFLNIIYMVVILLFKTPREIYWMNTSLCFSAGLWFSFFKENIISFLKDNKSYLLLLIILIVLFILLYKSRSNYLCYNCLSIIFVLIITILNMKIKIGNSILSFMGKNTFNIYILQRIPFIVFQKIGLASYNIYLYFAVSVLVTILLATIFDKICKKIFQLLKLQ